MANKKIAEKPLPPALLLRCGCEVRFRDGELPLCPAHGQQVIVRVLRMPPPRIRGTATGPHVQTADLGAWTGRLVGSEQKRDT
jgi:hypothetical protein